MAAHPAGKGLAGAKPPECGENYVVDEGDSLWTIASDALDTRSASVVARYWPVVYRSNDEVIGENPNLIIPKETLRLPECE
jgi:nucleoid-associated protein YgaU